MKRLLASIVFVALLVVALVYTGIVMRPIEDRGGNWKTYRSLESNTIDVLFTGSSKIYANINPVIIWENFGFTSYDLSGPILDFNTMNYYLRESFKTQHPKLVVIDILFIADEREVLEDNQLRNIMDMPFGVNKLLASANDNIEPSCREKALLPLEQYHSRSFSLNRLTKDDFLNRKYSVESKNVFMGYSYLSDAKSVVQDPKIKKFDEKLFDRHYLELQKTLDFLTNQNCEIMLIDTPSTQLDNLTYYENELEDRINQSYDNVSFFWPREYKANLNIDYDSEMFDGMHFNAKGAERFSMAVGRHIKRIKKLGLQKSLASKETSRDFQTEFERYCQYKISQEQGK